MLRGRSTGTFHGGPCGVDFILREDPQPPFAIGSGGKCARRDQALLLPTPPRIGCQPGRGRCLLEREGHGCVILRDDISMATRTVRLRHTWPFRGFLTVGYRRWSLIARPSEGAEVAEEGSARIALRPLWMFVSCQHAPEVGGLWRNGGPKTNRRALAHRNCQPRGSVWNCPNRQAKEFEPAAIGGASRPVSKGRGPVCLGKGMGLGMDDQLRNA